MKLVSIAHAMQVACIKIKLATGITISEKNSDMKGPPTLYRSFNGDVACKNHYKGCLWLRSYKYLRRAPGPGRDPSEGDGNQRDNAGISCDLFGEESFPSIFVLSFSEFCSRDFGEYVVKLSDPDSLRKRVQSKTPKGTEVFWQQMEYDKQFEFETFLGPSELMRNKHFAKPGCYIYEKEWRLVVRLPPEFWILNDTLKLHVGSLNHLLVHVVPELERGDK